MQSSEIDSYVAGQLNRNDRLRVQNHTWLCDECMRKVSLEALQLSVGERFRRLMFEEEPAVCPGSFSRNAA